VEAFVEGNAGTQAEDEDGDDESPEIDLHAMAERMTAVRRALGAPDAEKEQALIAGIDGGMDRLRQHGGGAGEEGGDELGDGDGEVARQRRIDDESGTGLVHALSPVAGDRQQ
jgi:hypothetical protein